MSDTGHSRFFAKSCAGASLDRTHLARQCLGDRALEVELLLMFRREAMAISAELAGEGGLSAADRAARAHRLRGSALAVGAHAVAREAERVEACGRAVGPGGQARAATAVELSQVIAALTEAVALAVAEIDPLQG